MDLTLVDVPADAPADIAKSALELWNQSDALFNPGDPPIGTDEFRRMVARATSEYETRLSLVRVDGDDVGVIGVNRLLGENRHLADVEELFIAPELRRRGYASAALRALARQLVADDYRSISLWAYVAGGEEFLLSCGLSFQIEERCSRLRIADLDLEQQRDWALGAKASAAGYRLVEIRQECPDEYLPAYCQARDAMADAPVGDLDFVHEDSDADTIRTKERADIEFGRDSFRVLALAPDGSGAGMTTLGVNLHRPSLGYQGDTAVVAAHRGHGIGRWLKATNMLRTLEAHPGLESVDTFNASDNPWMLAINVEMGFRPHQILRGHGGELATLT